MVRMGVRRSSRVALSCLGLSLALVTTALMVAQSSPARAATTSGTVYQWGTVGVANGDNSYGDLATPRPVAAIPAMVQVVPSAPGWASMALAADGSVWVWGDSTDGEYGNGSTGDLNGVPTQVPGLANVARIDGWRSKKYAVKTDGSVWTWGGYNGADIKTTPQPIDAFTSAKQIASSTLDGNTGIVLLANGTVVNFSYDSATNKWATSPVDGVSGIVQIAAIDSASSGAAASYYALGSSGMVYAWGDNKYGQLGDGTLNSHAAPTAIPGLAGIVQISAGQSHAVALGSNGAVWSWGWNQFGQLGDGTTTNLSSPKVITALSGITAIAAGRLDSYAVTSTGDVLGWGYNTHGNVGNGASGCSSTCTITSVTTPTQVHGISSVVSISSHDDVTMAISGTALSTSTSTATSTTSTAVSSSSSSQAPTPTPTPSPTTTPRPSSAPVKTHAYLAVSFIAPFSISGCTTDLVQGGILTGGALCGALRASANSFPPSSFDSGQFAAFAATKEYRGYVAIPSYTLSCNSLNQPISVTANGQFAFSLGYTKDNIKARTYYQLGDGYTSDNNFDRTSPDVYLTATGFTVTYKWASRVATAERLGQYALSHFDAPFVWSVFEENAGCNGSQNVRYTYADFPTTDVYIDGKEVLHDKQTGAIANFLKQGGTTFNPNGYGNLATPCHVKEYDAVSRKLTASYQACQSGGAGFGGGGSGGGGASGSW